MLEFRRRVSWTARVTAWVLPLWLLVGCATARINWDARVGSYSRDQAILDYGPPDKSADLTDGTMVYEWLQWHGSSSGSVMVSPGWYSTYDQTRSPDQYLRLVFDRDGKLKAWKRVLK
jgi:hypothetical protein